MLALIYSWRPGQKVLFKDGIAVDALVVNLGRARCPQRGAARSIIQGGELVFVHFVAGLDDFSERGIYSASTSPVALAPILVALGGRKDEAD